MSNRTTPYQRLLAAARDFRRRVMFPEKKELATTPAAETPELAAAIKTCRLLGYQVIASVSGDGQHIVFEAHKAPGDIDYIIYR